jgi:hypothetical protein
MRIRRGRAAAVGLLCAVAATIAAWSGPLASATSGFHASATAPGHAPAVAHMLR